VKRLYLLRHAKSSWDEPQLPDHDRPLAPRGRKAATRMASHLRDEGIAPAVVLCSSAVRARETLQRIAPALGPDVSALDEPELYGAGPAELLERLRRLPDALGSALVIGHNPGLQLLALSLAGTGADRSRLEEKLPTGALAALAADVPVWAELGPGTAVLTAFVVPRELV
jgi:phosphohistidine phosphatase